MNQAQTRLLEHLWEQYPQLLPQKQNLLDAFSLLCVCFSTQHKVLTCGNGGSAADSEHIVGELMKGFLLKRPLDRDQIRSLRAAGCGEPEQFAAGLQQGLPAISLVSQSALMTAFLNDVQPDMVFAQQAFAYGCPGDVLLALSTSGNSANVVNAALAAKAKGMEIIAFTGERESRLSAVSSVTFRVPAAETYRIQEYHLPLYHALCGLTELELFRE